MNVAARWAVPILALSVIHSAAIAAADAYPVRPIRLIIPFGPGASNDIVARIIAPRLSEGLGQSVVVDNRTGAGGIVAAELVAQAQPDGHTALMGSPGPLVVNPLLMPKLSYNPQRDFAPVSLVSIVPGVLLVNPATPVKSVKELIALAQGKPGQLNYASTGQGSVPHLSGELFKVLAKVDLVHVPYKNSSQGYIDVIAGQVQAMFFNLPGPLPHVKAGRLRALAVSSVKRAEQVPNVPTVIEAGIPDFEVTVWQGYAVPRGTPQTYVSKIHAAMMKALESPDLKQRFYDNGVSAEPMTPEAFRKFVQAETAKWKKVIAISGAKLE